MGPGSKLPGPIPISGRSELRTCENRAVTKARFHLTFPEHLINEPVIHRVGKEFDVVTNIRRANIEERQGWVILEMEGADDAIAAAAIWLVEQGLHVDRLEDAP